MASHMAYAPEFLEFLQEFLSEIPFRNSFQEFFSRIPVRPRVGNSPPGIIGIPDNRSSKFLSLTIIFWLPTKKELPTHLSTF